MNDNQNPECSVDLDRLREVTCGDQQLLQDICGQYVDQADQIINELDAAIEDEDQVRVRHLAHKLAGSSATCGMNAVVKPLQALENLQPYVNSEALELLRHISRQMELIRTEISKLATSANPST